MTARNRAASRLSRNLPMYCLRCRSSSFLATSDTNGEGVCWPLAIGTMDGVVWAHIRMRASSLDRKRADK